MKRMAIAVSLGSTLAMAGCGDRAGEPVSPALVGVPEQGSLGPGVEPTKTLAEPDGVATILTAYFEALHSRNHRVMRRLHRAEYTFCVRPDQADEFPWLQGECWNLGEEVGMLSHLFDPDFVGATPPAASIDADWVLVAQRSLGEDSEEATVDAFITVFTGPNEGYATFTRLVFEIATGRGNTGIRSIRESQVLLREETSWGEIKALWR